MANRAHAPAFVLGPMGLGTVLDDPEVVLAGQLHDGIHIRRPAGQVHHDDGLGAGGDGPLDGLGGNQAALGVYIGKNRPCSTHHRRAGRGNEGAGGGNNLVALAHPHGVKGQLERHRTVVQGNGVFGSDIVGKFTFEQAALLARPVVHFSRLEHLCSSFDLVWLKVGPWCKRHCNEGFF